jgi:hypothetical protein
MYQKKTNAPQKSLAILVFDFLDVELVVEKVPL